MEDFVKIVKRAGSVKRDPTEKKMSKIVKRVALLIGSQEYLLIHFAIMYVKENVVT